MKLADIFVSKVTRDIPPVVYFHDQSPQKLADEVAEYIITGGYPENHPHHRRVPSGIHEEYVGLLTAIADEFGAEIPCAPYVDNEGDNIGQAILKYRNRAPAILLANHGVFAWGASPAAALKAAVMTEDVAKTVWLAMQIGTPSALSPEEAEKWYDRYHNRYGQS